MFPFPIAGIAGQALGVLGKIPWWAWAMAVLVVWGGCARREAKVVRAEFETAKTTAAAERQSSEIAAKAETARIKGEHKEIVDDAQQKEVALQAAVAARNSSDSAARRLRDKLVALQAASCPRDPASPQASASAAAAGDLHAYVSRRLEEARGGIAQFADGAANAGESCERSYDALKP